MVRHFPLLQIPSPVRLFDLSKCPGILIQSRLWVPDHRNLRIVKTDVLYFKRRPSMAVKCHQRSYIRLQRTSSNLLVYWIL